MDESYSKIDTNLDNVFKVLSSSRRRGVLYSLKGSEGDTIRYDALVEDLIDEGYISEHERESFRLEMHHNHLPLLKDNGIIEYDSRSDTIRPVLDENLARVLETVEELEQDGFD